MSASWPTSVSTDSTLYVAVNELQNNLSAGINNSVTTVGLNSTTGFPSVGLVLIDNEVIKYGGISGNNLTSCTRAFDGTTAASHSSAAVVSFAFCAQHHNGVKDELIAIETYLSNNLGTGAQPLATGSRALASSAGGKITESSVTSTELGYLSGVTSAIQTQIAAKAPSASPTFSGTITTALTANRALTTGASGVLAVSATTDTELGYVSGVTSAIQTQMNLKAPLASPTFTGTVTVPNGSAATNAAAFGQIHVPQIPVTATSTTSTTTTSTTYVTGNLSATITPTSTSSKILVIATFGPTPSARQGFFTIARGGSDLSNGNGLGSSFYSPSATWQGAATITILDSPASVSALTYGVYMKASAGGSGSVGINADAATCTITLIEVI